MTTVTRYHMSPKLHVVGDLLTGNGKAKVDAVVEQILENRRPPGSLSRFDAVFTVEIPDSGVWGSNVATFTAWRSNCASFSRQGVTQRRAEPESRRESRP